MRIGSQAGLRLGFATPQVIHPGEEYLLDAIVQAEPACVLVRNLTALQYLRRQLPEAELVGDFSLNVANELTAAVLADRGLARTTIAYDLNATQVGILLARSAGLPLELIVHAHVPMFLTAYCPAAASLSHGNSCRDCGRPCTRMELRLRDRNGEEHPLRVDVAGRSVVYRSVPQSIVSVWARLSNLTLSHWRVELLNETPAESKQLVGLYSRLAAGDDSALAEWAERKTRARGGTLEHA